MKRITEVEIRQETAEVAPAIGTVVRVYLFAGSVAADSRGGKGSGNRP
jgi:hypothetical protein